MATSGEPFDYAAVSATAVAAEVEAAIAAAEAAADAIAALPEGKRGFESVMVALDEVDDVLGQASGRYGFLAQVSPDAGIREAAHAAEERIDQFATGLGFHEGLYRAVSGFAASGEGQALSGVEARLVERTLRDFRRNGLELPTEERARLRELKEQLISLGIRFRRNIDEYEDGIWVTRDELAGLPDAFIDSLRPEQGAGSTRYYVSLDYPELFPFLESAHDAARREELFRKNHNKAADQNVELLERAIALRDEAAGILDYDSWAAYVLEVRMAKDPGRVRDFLVDLEQRVRPKAEADLAEFAAVKRSLTGGDEAVAIWDWRYCQQAVLKHTHQVDPFAVAEYFPLEATLDGLFDVYQRLVQVEFVPADASGAWHPDVRYFDIVDRANGGGVVGHFYMDLHPRPDKFGHAAAFTLRSGRRRRDGTYQAPVSAIVANFTKPTPTTPSLLRHSEVVTLFHEFGHILHQTLTRSPYVYFSGTRVEREHWCWEPAVLRSFTRHYRSGDPLPEDLLARMVAAKNVGSGVAALRQLYFGRLDLAYHGPGGRKDTDAIARELHGVTAFPFPEGTHFQAGFGHLFGYDAGYYGYLWSKVFGDDMFTRFEGTGPEAEGAGRAYRTGILERGGTVDGEALVREFLGREPRPEAFLRDLGVD
jgi:thimet oligopeptidase